jgi:hypothetical protein
MVAIGRDTRKGFRMFALGQKRTCAAQKPMSALGQKRTSHAWFEMKEAAERGGLVTNCFAREMITYLRR